ncbi:hypothetical protein [Aerococcus urinae]|uniref:hypothetical protein n=1 Tax=Aerococcus urinae TaxID=1376 RepID=UPI000DCD8C0E|nr:hypothetical protein [Aerococcus urinae]MDK7303560.1 hypothetical protein [Aerococcus urinae]RAW04131.1 hypothetical protein DBT41_09305 [Aerococcus urinae]
MLENMSLTSCHMSPSQVGEDPAAVNTSEAQSLESPVKPTLANEVSEATRSSDNSSLISNKDSDHCQHYALNLPHKYLSLVEADDLIRAYRIAEEVPRSIGHFREDTLMVLEVKGRLLKNHTDKAYLKGSLILTSEGFLYRSRCTLDQLLKSTLKTQMTDRLVQEPVDLGNTWLRPFFLGKHLLMPLRYRNQNFHGYLNLNLVKYFHFFPVGGRPVTIETVASTSLVLPVKNVQIKAQLEFAYHLWQSYYLDLLSNPLIEDPIEKMQSYLFFKEYYQEQQSEKSLS